MPRLIPVALVLLALATLVAAAPEDQPEPPKPEPEAPAPEAPEEPVTPEEPKAEAPPEAPKAPASDPEALAILAKAIAHQAPEELTGPESIKDLYVRIQAEVWDYRGEKAKKQSVNVSRYLCRDPKQFRSEWRTTGGVLVNGFDGRRFWFADFDAAGKKNRAQLLTGSTYANDRQRISDEMAETEYLLRFFFLGNLKGDRILLTKMDDETIDAYGKKECHVLHRVNQAKDTTEPELTLWFEKATNELVRAVAHARKEKDRTLRFTFKNDADVQPRVKGVLFPFKMELHEKSKKIGDYRLSTRATLEEKGIDFNSGIDAKRFIAPIGDAAKGK